MNSLISGIESAIKNAIEEYSKNIIEKYPDIDADELETLWNSVCDTTKISVSFKQSSAKKSKNESEDSTTENGCPYKYIKGKNADTTCNSKPKDGNVYCSRHKKHEGSGQKEKKILPVAKKNTVQPTKKPKSPPKTTARVLRKHKLLGKLWHQETGFVFKSEMERIVIGKCVDNKIVNLSEDDYDECKKWGFPFLKPDENDDGENEENDDGENEENDDGKNEENEENEENEDDKKTGTSKSIYMVADSSSDSGEKKFWKCSVSDKTMITTHGKYGKDGKDGKTKTKTFETYEDAVKDYDKNVKSKSKKGYKETTETKSTKSSDNDSEDLEEVINELQGDSSDENKDEDKKKKKSVSKSELKKNDTKNFIANALGLSAKKQVDENDDEMFMGEFEDDDEE